MGDTELAWYADVRFTVASLEKQKELIKGLENCEKEIEDFFSQFSRKLTSVIFCGYVKIEEWNLQKLFYFIAAFSENSRVGYYRSASSDNPSDINFMYVIDKMLFITPANIVSSTYYELQLKNLSKNRIQRTTEEIETIK